MYRAVTLYAIQNNLISEVSFNEDDLVKQLVNITLTFKCNSQLGFSEIYLNDKNVEPQIRTLEVSTYVSIIAANSQVRKKLVEQQQKMGENRGVVMDGRDIGTVVFPDAELKLFMTASADVRAKRRFDELIERGDNVDYSEVLNNVVNRDKIDTTREDSPLVKANDAIEVDNSNLSRDEQFQKILRLVLDFIK